MVKAERTMSGAHPDRASGRLQRIRIWKIPGHSSCFDRELNAHAKVMMNLRFLCLFDVTRFIMPYPTTKYYVYSGFTIGLFLALELARRAI